MKFLDVLAWGFGVASTLLAMLRLYFSATYSELDKIKDSLHGIRREWRITNPMIVAIICWSWIIAQHFARNP